MTDIEGIIRRVVREELDHALAPDLGAPRPLIATSEPGRRSDGSAVGDEILVHLARRHQTQTWLADQTGIPIATLSRRLRDSGSFRLSELRSIAHVLQVDLRDLIGL